MQRLVFSFLLLLSAAGLMAQDSLSAGSDKRLYIGFGTANVMDTYLSPYSYKGSRLDLLYEKRGVHFVHELSLHGSWMENMAKNVNEYDAAISYELTRKFSLLRLNALQVDAGPMGRLYAGCLYNERNGNNPAQARLSLLAGAACRASYMFRALNRDCSVEYMLSLPLIGLAYSPQFGQSYYEEFVLGNADHNCVIAHPFNTPSLSQRIVLGISLGHSRLYIGYNSVIDQTKYNNLRYHSYSHSLLLGINL